MPESPIALKRGRRGRRTAAMVRIARERILDLFELAHHEATEGDPRLADRYVALARDIGARYNVRFLPEYRELYCRGCSAYWVEGRTVRTRLRSGRRVRTCLRCGRERRTLNQPRGETTGLRAPGVRRLASIQDEALVVDAPTSGTSPSRRPLPEGP